MPDMMELLGLGTILFSQISWNEVWQLFEGCKCYSGDEFSKQLAAQKYHRQCCLFVLRVWHFV